MRSKSNKVQKTFLITGSAGFLGFHLASRLLEQGHIVLGIDKLVFYPILNLSSKRNEILLRNPNYQFFKADLCDYPGLSSLLENYNITAVFHFAATSNVQASIDNPHSCFKNNMSATVRLLEALRKLDNKPLFFLASSASVYGLSGQSPFKESDSADTPISMYAVSKRSAELMFHMYANTYGIEGAVFRLFSVYGPWINPELAPLKFVRSILDGAPLQLLNNGDMLRDMVYIHDVIDGILGVFEVRSRSATPPFNIFNLGAGAAVPITEVTAAIEKGLGKKTIVNLVPFKGGHAYTTVADIHKIQQYCGFRPKMPLERGLKLFCEWYLNELPHFGTKATDSVSQLSHPVANDE